MASDAEHLFMSLGLMYVLLGEKSVQALCKSFNWIVCLPRVESGEFIIYLEIKPLSEISLTNTFSHTCTPLFILLVFSLAIQKLFILLRSHLFIHFFIFYALGDIMKISMSGISEIFLPIISSRTFVVSQLIFKSFIHNEFILMYGMI